MAPLKHDRAFREDVADHILEQIMNGKTLSWVCDNEANLFDPPIPPKFVIYHWMETNPEFAAQHVRARQYHAFSLDDRLQEIADKSTGATFQQDRVKANILMWRTERANARTFALSQKLELSGPDGGAIKTVTAEMDAKEAAASFEAMLGRK